MYANMTREQVIDDAVEKFDAGFNCAEAVFAAGAAYAGISSPLIPRAATALGAGVGRMQNLCGIISGGVMAIGLVYGRDDQNGDRFKPYELARRYAAAVERIRSSTMCSEITGVDMADPDQNAAFRQPGGVHYTVCGPLMRRALDELFAILDGE